MKRDDVIEQVADIVGKKHSVDLKNYDLLILVEIYRVRKHPCLFNATDQLSYSSLADYGVLAC